MTTPLEQAAEKVLRRANERLGSISVECMNGDNISILLCGYFDNPYQENDDESGWTPDAITGCGETLDAIRQHYFREIIPALQSYSEQCAKAALEKAAETAQSLYCDGDISGRDRTAYVIAKFIRNLDPAQIVKEMNHD